VAPLRVVSVPVTRPVTDSAPLELVKLVGVKLPTKLLTPGMT